MVKGHYSLLVFFLFFQTPPSQVTECNLTKLCHILESNRDLKMVVQNLEVAYFPITSSPKTAYVRVVYMVAQKWQHFCTP